MNYKIDKTEVLRYLGIKGNPDPQTERLIEKCAKELCSAIRPKYTSHCFDLLYDGKNYSLMDCNTILSGETADSRLHGCSYCYVMAATLGHEADTLIRKAQVTDMARAVVYDACATDLIEKVCDCAEAEISSLAKSKGLYARQRFSPGYGDLPLSLQKDISRLLDTGRKIGVTLTDELLLLPTKSVTAFIGISPAPSADKPNCKNSCENCNMANRCTYRK